MVNNPYDLEADIKRTLDAIRAVELEIQEVQESGRRTKQKEELVHHLQRDESRLRAHLRFLMSLKEN